MSSYFLKILYALLLLLLHTAGSIIGFSSPTSSGDVKCVEKERQALLNFQQGIGDFHGMLSTWRDDEKNGDCCKWKGIECSNETGHIQMLDLRGSDTQWLIGVIDLSLLIELQGMEYLDLSRNNFIDSPIPGLMGSFSNLRYLNLSFSLFGGTIPHQLGNLSQLQYLELGQNIILQGAIPHQLGNLSQLRHLGLEQNDLSGVIPFQIGDLPMLQTLRLDGNYNLKINEKNHVDAEWLRNLTLLTNLGLAFLNLSSSHHWLHSIRELLPNLRELRLSGCSLSDNDILSLFDSHSNVSTSLAILDLSHNMLTTSTLQRLFNFSFNLQELYLSNNNFVLSSPVHLTFPSDLVTLDLSYNKLSSSIFQGNFIFGSKLQSLYLRNCSLLDNSFLVPSASNLSFSSSLVVLDLSSNELKSSTIFHWLFNFTTNLHRLHLSNNLLEGPILESFGNMMKSLEILYLSYNKMQGEIPTSFGNISRLQMLYLSNNRLIGEIPKSIGLLSELVYLDLSGNSLEGEIPESFGLLSKLQYLDLSGNSLEGEIPESFRLLSELDSLDLSGNSLEGDIMESHLTNFSKLKSLYLSGQKLSPKFGASWVPPFQLIDLEIASCSMGPSFPSWLHTQSYLRTIDISDAGISDTVPNWFWHMSQNMYKMNISHNSLRGIIPNLPLKLIGFPILIFTSNQFEGSIPPFLLKASALHLSQNRFSDLDSLLCGKTTAESLGILDVSNNQLKGKLPDCWNHLNSLEYLDLSNNKLSGKIPLSIGTLVNLKAFVLRNNSITGELPSSMKSLNNLTLLDVGENKLSGDIPLWIGESLHQLVILSLRVNHFVGGLPLQICYLTNITVLDLSENHLSEQIPTCVKNFTALAEISIGMNHPIHHYFQSKNDEYVSSYDFYMSLMWKGKDEVFKHPELLLRSIDLSSNNLTGETPIEIGSLFGLVSLNLSRNNLSGEIISGLGNLRSLEFLDLSRNHLSGTIPSSLVQIDRLSVLDLSNNHLYGKIPIGTQLQSFNASSYEGNLDLCGKPLDKICPDDVTPMPQVSSVFDHEEEESIFSEAFYMSLGLGFAVGFWGFLGPILLFRSWRYSYVKFLSKLTDSIYVLVLVYMARCQSWVTS